MEEFIKQQTTTGGYVQQVISNYKKDPKDRKTNRKYFSSRLSKLKAAEEEFNETHAEILKLAGTNRTHEYFTKDYYVEIISRIQSYSKEFEQAMMSIEESAGSSSTSNPGTSTSSDEIAGIVRKQTALMNSLQRQCSVVIDNNAEQSDLMYEINRQMIQEAWKELRELNLTMWERCDNPAKWGYNDDNYITVEKVTQQALTMLSIKVRQQSSLITDHGTTDVGKTVQMTKITIPKFDGNYSEWQQFHDLFMDMIHNQSITNSQKMWYLVTSLTGQPRNLIKHLSITNENYNLAWQLITNRYSNKRAIVKSIIKTIVDQKTITSRASAADIRKLHDDINEGLLTLQSINVDGMSLVSAILTYLILPKLDKYTRDLYEQSLSNTRETPNIKELLNFLNARFESLEAMENTDTVTASTHKTLTVSQVSANCKLCKGTYHPMYNCAEFLHKSEVERSKITQDLKLCFNCLRSGHSAKDCKSRSCKTCNKKHNSLLPCQSKLKPSMEKTTLFSVSSPRNSYVLLGTAAITISDKNGDKVKCRAILDSGSQVNLITQRLVKRLQLNPSPISIVVEGIGKGKKGIDSAVLTKIHSRVGNYSATINAFVLQQIVSKQPQEQLSTSGWKIPQNLTLADPEFNCPGDIDILLGAEYYHDILLEGYMKLSKQLPAFQNTVFGWICVGKIDNIQQSMATCGIYRCEDEDLNASLTKFWQLDEVRTDTKDNLTEAEKKCEELYQQTTTRNFQGRFIVRLPFKEDNTCLGESLQMATNRFYSLEQKLIKNPKIKQMYVEFMREYERLGHMEKVRETLTKPYYVIPHHCVLKPDSSTTKLRVVFDASAKTSSGISLNDITYKGPVVQSELISILLRFRKHRFVFTTDVEKMYRQIFIHPEDHRFQTIVWRENPQDKLQLYHLTTVTYGTRPAPYLSTKCLQRIAQDNKAMMPLGATALNNDFYVDDGLSGSDSLVEAVEIKNQLTKMLSAAGLKLRKWCANSPQLLEGIPITDQEVNLDLDDETTIGVIKTLGLIWLPKSDEMCIKANHEFSKVTTKRIIISEVARVYDPLGLVAPVIVKAKIFIQRLWQLKVDWDEKVSAKHEDEWNEFRQEINMLNDLRIPRHVMNHKQVKNLQLHVFTDASERAYGAAVYVRSENKDNTIAVHLLCSKSRVAPLKTQTIPRLELCAALLGAELITRVKQDLEYHQVVVHMWTDSEVTLNWINAEPATFQTFVSHRIAKIQELTSANQWRHVRSKDNPADLLSRGIKPSEIKNNSFWWYGPMFLHGKEVCWPPIFNAKSYIGDQVEQRKCTVGISTTGKDDLINMIYNIKHNGSFSSLQRIVAYMLRFAANTRQPTKTKQNFVCTTELNNALNVIIQAIQQSEFADEIKNLATSKELKPSSPLNGLTPFIDAHGIIRVGGRLQEANLPFDARHPILLPYNDILAKLIMREVHENNHHCGPQALLAQTRQRFWPIKGKIMARSIVQHCVRCTRTQPKMFKQIMGNLPQDRVQLERPFLNAGVDFCGPIQIHHKIRGKRPCKAYIAVFCCFATKAVHLELVGDLTTAAFIGALTRFISRRGRCQRLHCDNATNFIGANNQLAELKDCIYADKASEDIHNACAKRGIEFKFIPPRAPHFGGLWEAAVKSAKHLLVRSLGGASLTYEELETLVVQIEGILNSRPITPMSSSPNDLMALTPGHFLIGEPLTSQPIPNTNNIGASSSLLQRWKLVHQLKNDFWSRWTKEYLNELQYRTKWKTQSANVTEGTMVILKEDNLQPLHWPLGRITRVITGPDGHVRVVEVKTASGTLKRAIHRVAPLMPEEQSESIKTKEEDTHSKERNNDIQPCKRAKLSLNSTMLTILALILCLPLAIGNSIEITHFENKPGIHFENIGQSNIITTHWNLLIYYDLGPLKEELSAIAKGTAMLEQLCRQLKHEVCPDLVFQFAHTRDELTEDNKIFWQSRSKRGAVNVIGNIASSLFGVLDSEYAEQMSQTLQHVDNNEKFMLEMIKNQTSIIDSTINIMKVDQEAVKRKFDAFDKSLNDLKLHAQRTIKDQTLFQSMVAMALHLIIATANVRRIQTTMLNVLTDVHHGQIGPLLLSPEQLKREILNIKGHLPPSQQIPAQQNDLLMLYKIMSVEAGLTKNHILFKITLPIIEAQKFNMFQIIPIPTTVNGTLVSIKATTDILAITAHGDKYYPLTQQQFKECSLVNSQSYLCPYTQAIYNMGAHSNSCEANLFNNESRLTCEVIEVFTNQWFQLNNKNHWAFALKNPIKITAVCKEEIQQVFLEGAGILKMKPDCSIKNDFFSILGQQTIETIVMSSITTHGNWSYLQNPKTTEYVSVKDAITPYNAELQELTTLQELLKNQQILQLPNEIKRTDQHQFAIGYTALTLTFIMILYIAITKACKIRRQHRTSFHVPTPAPRLEDFSVNV